MKRIQQFTFVCLLALVFTSCVSTNKGFQSSPVIARMVQLDPIKADISVDESKKLSGESKSTYFLFFRISGDNTSADGINYSADVNSSIFDKFNIFNIYKTAKLKKVRSSAAYNALSTGDYDFLAHPNYVTTTKNYLGIVQVYKCSVSGYGAKYKNFRTERQKVVVLNTGKEYVFPDNK